MNALELQDQPDLPDDTWNSITLSLSLPDRAALSRIKDNIVSVAADIAQSSKEHEAMAFARLCLLAVRWLEAASVAVDRVFLVAFDDADRQALSVSASYLRRLSTREWGPEDWKKGELADWKVMWALMLDLHDSLTEAEQAVTEEDMRRPI